MQYNLTEMKELATEIAKNSHTRDVILLKGDMGTGKTTFAKAFINYFIPGIEVTSPTFNIFNVYEGGLLHEKQCKIYHFDLFRLSNQRELFEIGLEEMLADGICLIEWPKEFEMTNANRVLCITIEFVQSNEKRLVCIN